jgi:flagellar biosynthesis GTPase FlhF
MKTEESTQQRREDNQNVGKLLSPEEREVFKQLAGGEAPWSQRALTLLALDQGVTQVEAGELSGLTVGQVRYWRDKFRQQRLGIFPGDPSDGPTADAGSVSAEDRPQRESERAAATVSGQPKAESKQGARKKNSAAPKGADKTAKKAKRVNGKKKKQKKKADKKKQSKKKKQKKKNETEIKSGKKAKKPGRDKKKTKKKTETTKKGKKSSKKGKK